MTRANLAWLAFIVACSGNGDDPTHDAAVADTPVTVAYDAAPSFDAYDVQICLQLRTQWTTRVAALDRSCATPADCVLVGGRSVVGCTCDRVTIAPQGMGECSGIPVNAAAAAAAMAELEALEDAFFGCLSSNRCGEAGVPGCACDCKTGSTAACVNQRCEIGAGPSCPPLFHDAGARDAT